MATGALQFRSGSRLWITQIMASMGGNKPVERNLWTDGIRSGTLPRVESADEHGRALRSLLVLAIIYICDRGCSVPKNTMTAPGAVSVASITA